MVKGKEGMRFPPASCCPLMLTPVSISRSLKRPSGSSSKLLKLRSRVVRLVRPLKFGFWNPLTIPEGRVVKSFLWR